MVGKFISMEFKTYFGVSNELLELSKDWLDKLTILSFVIGQVEQLIGQVFHFPAILWKDNMIQSYDV